jgi:hypothetical protein
MLEKKIEELTEAIKSLTAAMPSGAAQDGVEGVEGVEKAPAVKTKKTPATRAKKETPKKEDLKKEESDDVLFAGETPVTIDDVRRSVQELVKKEGSQATAILILGKHNVKRLTDLPQEKFKEVLAEVKEALKGV